MLVFSFKRNMRHTLSPSKSVNVTAASQGKEGSKSSSSNTPSSSSSSTTTNTASTASQVKGEEDEEETKESSRKKSKKKSKKKDASLSNNSSNETTASSVYSLPSQPYYEFQGEYQLLPEAEGEEVWRVAWNATGNELFTVTETHTIIKFRVQYTSQGISWTRTILQDPSSIVLKYDLPPFDGHDSSS